MARFMAIGSGIAVMAGMGLATPAHAATGTNVPFTGTASSIPFVNTSQGDSAGLVAVGDFSGNGPHDLAVADGAGGAVYVMLNNGSGQFTPKEIAGNFSGSFISAIAAGNLGGKGPGEDIAITDEGSDEVENPGAGEVILLLRDGHGGYNESFVPVGAAPDAIAIGDLNNDGRADIAVTNADGDGSDEPGDSGTITLLLNQGGGNFASETLTGGLGDTFQGSGPGAIAIGDLQGTGHAQDLAVITGGNNPANDPDLNLFLNSSGNAFMPTYTRPAALQGGFDASSVAIGKLGGPGPGSDIAVGDAGPQKFRGATLFLNQGDANFVSETIPSGISTFSFQSAIAVGNLDGTNRPGFALDNPASGLFTGSVSVFIKDVNDGNFAETTVPVAPDSGPESIVMGNFAGDRYPNRLDMVVGEEFSDTLTLITNTTLVPTKLAAGPLLNSAYPAYTANAVLLDTLGQPIAGQTITFTTGTTAVCTATTNAAGLAKCQNLKVAAAETANKGYTATYAGSTTFQAGSAKGALG